jgi:hypothetical protein
MESNRYAQPASRAPFLDSTTRPTCLEDIFRRTYSAITAALEVWTAWRSGFGRLDGFPGRPAGDAPIVAVLDSKRVP